MHRRRPETRKCFEVHRRGIAFVYSKAVARVLLLQTREIGVATDFRKDRRCADRRHSRIPTDDGSAGIGPLRATVAVDEYELRRLMERFDGAAHREKAGVEDVEYVYLGGARAAHRPRQSVCADRYGKPFARACSELLGVGKAGKRRISGKNHGSRDDVPRERPATGLIHTCNQAMTDNETSPVSRAGNSGMRCYRYGRHPAAGRINACDRRRGWSPSKRVRLPPRPGTRTSRYRASPRGWWRRVADDHRAPRAA